MKNAFSYPSKDGITNIHATEWKPVGDVRAVLQISHGMIEFIDRYDRFANFLCDYGILVVGNDHLGHGESVVSDAQHGYFAKNGNECVIEDMHTLQALTAVRYPNVPYFLLGHSMGSFLVRQYIEKYGNALAGAIIMGTSHQSTATLRSAEALCISLAKIHGWEYRSPLLHRMTLGSYNKEFEPSRTRNDWLTRDERLVDTYNGHPWNNFRFTINAYYHMFKGMEYANHHIKDTPADLPIFIVSGAKDPVGQFGLGAKKVYDSLKKAGVLDIQMRLYENDRHELLNEINHNQIDHDILNWLQEHMEKE